MYKSDIKRKEIIQKTVESPEKNSEKRFKKALMLRKQTPVMVTYDNNENQFIYRELLNNNFWAGLYAKDENKTLTNTDALINFIKGRVSKIVNELDLAIDSYTYEDGVLSILLYQNDLAEDDIFNELEGKHTKYIVEDDDKNDRLNDVQLKKHRERHNDNTKRVDMLLKTVFTEKFEGKYEVNTDVGKWKCVRGMKKNGKLNIVWEHKESTQYKIHTLLFPKDTNKVIVSVYDRSGKVVANRDIEIYTIPIHPDEIEKFYRKTLFNELKRYIDSEVIKLEPFNEEYVFWDAENPDYPYSFSTPSRNKIILGLIHFINVARTPRLSDFFEKNNLKHKQGYLQILLDSAEDAGIFKFYREGNEIFVNKGPNYRDFLDGKIRKI